MSKMTRAQGLAGVGAGLAVAAIAVSALTFIGSRAESEPTGRAVGHDRRDAVGEAIRDHDDYGNSELAQLMAESEACSDIAARGDQEGAAACHQDVLTRVEAAIGDIEANAAATDAAEAAFKQSPEYITALGKYKGCMAKAGHPNIESPEEAQTWTHPSRAQIQAPPVVQSGPELMPSPTTTIAGGGISPDVQQAIDDQRNKLIIARTAENEVLDNSYGCEVSSGLADLTADFVMEVWNQ